MEFANLRRENQFHFLKGYQLILSHHFTIFLLSDAINRSKINGLFSKINLGKASDLNKLSRSYLVKRDLSMRGKY